MMRLKSPTIAGFLLAANPTNVIPLALAKASAAELIAPTAIINSTPERTPLATNSQPIRLDKTKILASNCSSIDAPIALSKALWRPISSLTTNKSPFWLNTAAA